MEQVNQEDSSSLNKINTLIETATDYVQKLHCHTTKWMQPFKCAVATCHNAFFKYDPEYKLPYKFHTFPVDQNLRQIWMQKCGIEHSTETPLLICSDHFHLDDYERNFKAEFKNPNYKRKLKADAVPSKKICNFNAIQNLDHTTILQYNPDLHIEENVENVPSYDIVKPILDENIIFKEKLQKLKQIQSEILLKSKFYDRKVRTRKNDLWALKNKIDKLKRSGLLINGQRNLLSKVFSDAQINVLLRKRKVTWSNDDLAMAFSLRQMSSKECYLYLKRTLNLPLPALSCVQKWMASK